MKRFIKYKFINMSAKLKFVVITTVILGATPMVFVAAKTGYNYAQKIINSKNNIPQEKVTDSTGGKADTSISGNVQNGSLDLTDSKEIEAQLQKETDESYMSYKININPVFSNGNSLGNLMIENSKDNKYILQVEIINATTNSIYYKSPILKPNQSIQKDKLNVDLPKGTYNAIAMFKCYEKETNNFVGQAGMKIKITILN